MKRWARFEQQVDYKVDRERRTVVRTEETIRQLLTARIVASPSKKKGGR